MNHLDKLKNAAKAPIVNYTRFLLKYKNDLLNFHFFIEGDDDKSFYTNYIIHYLSDKYKIHYYVCDGKNGVLDNYSQIDWNKYDERRVMFFIDKDHSDFIGEKTPEKNNIFITAYYSIENYLVNDFMLERVLSEMLNLTDEQIEIIKTHFNGQLQYFINCFYTITAWIIYIRRIGQKPNVNNINLPDIFFFDESLELNRRLKPRNKKLLSYLEKCTSVTTPVNSWKQIKSIRKKLISIDNYKSHLRGKYELWFMISYLTKIPLLLNQNRESGSVRVKYSVSLCLSNAIQIFAPRLNMPEDIKKFLEQRFSFIMN